MDNLTHSLVGALLGQMGLKRKTGLAMPTLIIAANIPDIDAVAVLLGGHQHLAIRRGLTHGPIAMVLLPLLLWGAMLWFDSWQTRREKRPEKRLPVHKGWLLALAYIGCLSHPLFDWFNSYGVRLLEPFSSQWFYGDTLFIVDVWIWIALIAGVWISLRRERSGGSRWQRPAWISFTAICAYIFVNGAMTGYAEDRARKTVEYIYQLRPSTVVANPVPLKFWEREILWNYVPEDQAMVGSLYGFGDYSLMNGVTIAEQGHDLPSWAHKRYIGDGREVSRHSFNNGGISRSIYDHAVANSPDAAAFIFWSRMPIFSYDYLPTPSNFTFIQIEDQRFRSPLVGDRFRVKVLVSPEERRLISKKWKKK
jgi:inner membrane protein